MDDPAVIGNLVEAVLWLAFVAVCTALAFRATGRKRRLWLVLAVAFLVFSASDIIESQTGAWWRPFWLLILKGSCIAVFLYGGWEYRRILLSQGIQPCAPPTGHPETRLDNSSITGGSHQ